jgi:phosphoserine phosphatase
MKVILLRHGETKYNIEKRLQSSKDSLTEKGKDQIMSLKNKLSKFNFNKIISSNEKRAIETAEIISNWSNLKFKTIPLIREKESGNFSDKLVNEVDWSIVKGDFLNKKIPGGESINDVINRASKFLSIINKFNQNDSVLVISHGTFLRILYCLIFNKNIEDYLINYEFPNATYLVLTKDKEGKWKLEESSFIKK